jgi:hypothetical protein
MSSKRPASGGSAGPKRRLPRLRAEVWEYMRRSQSSRAPNRRTPCHSSMRRASGPRTPRLFEWTAPQTLSATPGRNSNRTSNLPSHQRQRIPCRSASQLAALSEEPAPPCSTSAARFPDRMRVLPRSCQNQNTSERRLSPMPPNPCCSSRCWATATYRSPSTQTSSRGNQNATTTRSAAARRKINPTESRCRAISLRTEFAKASSLSD